MAIKTLQAWCETHAERDTRCVVCGIDSFTIPPGQFRTYPTMASLNDDGVVVRVHSGRCLCEHKLTLARTTEHEAAICRAYLERHRRRARYRIDVT